MGALKKMFGIQEKTTEEEDRLKRLEGKEVHIISLEKKGMAGNLRFHGMLHDILKQYKLNRKQGKPVPPKLIEQIHYLEEQLDIGFSKIEREVKAELKDESAVKALLEGLERSVNAM